MLKRGKTVGHDRITPECLAIKSLKMLTKLLRHTHRREPWTCPLNAKFFRVSVRRVAGQQQQAECRVSGTGAVVTVSGLNSMTARCYPSV